MKPAHRMALDLSLDDLRDETRTLPAGAALVLGFGIGFGVCGLMVLATVAGYLS